MFRLVTNLPEGGGGDWLEAVEVSPLPPAVTSVEREKTALLISDTRCAAPLLRTVHLQPLPPTTTKKNTARKV